MMFVRPAVNTDLPDLAAAAQHLDSVNLPHDQSKLREVIQRSERSFAAVAGARATGATRAGATAPGPRAALAAAATPGPDVTPTPLTAETAVGPGEFLFVMVDRDDRGHERVVGSSMIFAQHGSRRAPHSFFDVIEEERYSETLDRHFRHKILRMGYNYDGLTELGGLVLLPAFRGHPERLGKTLVFVRFLYIALFRGHFRDQMVSELMPPLEPDGTSLLWESLGRHFTGLSYQEADRLSRENKEFIRALFPQDPIYATLLPPAAQERIGQVGPHTKAVEKMLTGAGFRYAQRIDPFDGGPHFHARTDELIPIRKARRARVEHIDATPPAEASPGAPARSAIVAVSRPNAPHFIAVRSPIDESDVATQPGRDGDRGRGAGVRLPAAIAALLGVVPGDEVGLLPL
jgi:arginine N-succinyltransferase